MTDSRHLRPLVRVMLQIGDPDNPGLGHSQRRCHIRDSARRQDTSVEGAGSQQRALALLGRIDRGGGRIETLAYEAKPAWPIHRVGLRTRLALVFKRLDLPPYRLACGRQHSTLDPELFAEPCAGTAVIVKRGGGGGDREIPEGMPSEAFDRQRAAHRPEQSSLLGAQRLERAPQILDRCSGDASLHFVAVPSPIGDAHDHREACALPSERAQHHGKAATRPENDDRVIRR